MIYIAFHDSHPVIVSRYTQRLNKETCRERSELLITTH